MLAAVFAVIIFLFVLFTCVKSMQNAPRSYNYNQIKAINDSINSNVNYDSKSKTLFVNKREPRLKNLLKREAFISEKFGHKPEKLVYTGATVGGVTTGGVHKTGGDYVQYQRSGKYWLKYLCIQNNVVEEDVIIKIVLSNNLAKEAQTSRVKDYLDGNTIVVMKPMDNRKALEAMRLGYRNEALTLQDAALAESAPTLEKVNNIMLWICGED